MSTKKNLTPHNKLKRNMLMALSAYSTHSSYTIEEWLANKERMKVNKAFIQFVTTLK